ncbi:hypothetical protein F2P56_023065 [Juglans regia]|uniref:Uncharacterized protein n=1 Tax=Juglans regia TaxID=51240 RepID=A0A833U9D4_JUGRE|nr:hypothetical protein F2P56_023065 [Juglans regia]
MEQKGDRSLIGKIISERRIGKEVARSMMEKVWKKALNNCLPTNENLYRRKVVKKPVCPICLREDEIVCHVLWSCPATMDVWAEKESPVQKWKSSEVDLAEVWRKLIAELPLDSMEMVVSVMRYIWLRRNWWIFERKFTSPGSVLQQARANLNEFQQAQQQGIERSKTAAVERMMVRWEAPKEGFVKVNWDAAFKANQRKMGAGVVVRDEEGNVQVSLCMPKDCIQSAVIAEATALWRALCLCAELNIQKAVLEGDSLEVIKAVNDREECLEWHGHII